MIDTRLKTSDGAEENWDSTGMCPHCIRRSVVDDRCALCGWENQESQESQESEQAMEHCDICGNEFDSGDTFFCNVCGGSFCADCGDQQRDICDNCKKEEEKKKEEKKK